MSLFRGPRFPRCYPRPRCWAELVEAEPLLLDLERIVRNTEVTPTMPPYWRTWSRYKSTLQQLVGWYSINPRLRTEACYILAHDHLLRLYEDQALLACMEGGN